MSGAGTKRTCALTLARAHATVDDKDLTADVTGTIRCEEEHCVGNVLLGRHTFARLFLELFAPPLRVPKSCGSLLSEEHDPALVESVVWDHANDANAAIQARAAQSTRESDERSISAHAYDEESGNQTIAEGFFCTEGVAACVLPD